MSETPVIIEAAINGGSSKRRNKNVPREPTEVIEDAYRCLDAGAAIIHAHNSDYALTGRAAADDYLLAWRTVMYSRPDTLWYPTLCGGRGVAEVLDHFRILAAEVPLRIGVVDPGSTNLGRARKDGLPTGVLRAVAAWAGEVCQLRGRAIARALVPRDSGQQADHDRCVGRPVKVASATQSAECSSTTEDGSYEG